MNRDTPKRISELGIRNFALEKFYQRIVLKKQRFHGEGSYSSISDDDNWVGFCNFVSIDDQAFQKFRRYMVLHDVLEHVTFQTANLYLEMIKPRFEVSEISHLARNFDQIGDPFEFNFKSVGKASSLFFRYLKVASDIKILFGDKFNSVAEIGVGFGGQIQLLNQLVSVDEYHLFDLPSVQKMATKYLNLNQIWKINSDILQSKPENDYDLIISNFAFSELKRVHQEQYFSQVIERSRCGYITWNHLSEQFLDGMNIDELISRKPDIAVVSEHLSPTVTNQILVWGVKNLDRLWALSGSNRRPTD